jgi:5-dehydro-4-deoxyglucarate dehydratase
MPMSPEDLKSALGGVIAFPVTPFADDLSLDLDAFRKNLRGMLAHPLVGVVAPGGTGEMYSLTPDEHLAVTRAAVEEAAGRVPVIAGVGFNTALASALARQAAEAGASGILAFPPYYPQADDDGLFEYYRAIGNASPLGLLVYSRDWVHPGPAAVARLAAGIPTLVAWKDGQGDIRRLQALRARVGERLYWIGGAGDDMVPAYYSTGIRAFTSSIANIAPHLAVQLHEAAAAGNAAALQPLMTDLIVPLYAMRARRRGYEVTVMKVLMNLMGLAGGRVRPPLPELHEDHLAEVKAMAARWAAAVQSAGAHETRAPREQEMRR